MSRLFNYQESHKNRLVELLTTYKRALDVSKTGSGKSVVSLHIYKEFNHLPLIVVCPPTLIPNWIKHIQHELGDIDSQIISSHQIKKIKKSNCFLIVDECQDFKNQVNRTLTLGKLVNRMVYTLFMSATPIDDLRQETGLDIFLGDFSNRMSKMNFEYETTNRIYLHHFVLDREKEYSEGYKNIKMSGVALTKRLPYASALFNKGLREIHTSLFPALLQLLRNTKLTKKYIIVLHYKDHYKWLKEEYPNILILNGGTPQTSRGNIIHEFQTNPNVRMIAISAMIGGIGIELDDIIGDEPREIIMLPTSNGISFTQIIGRVQRTNTKSNSIIRVVQPNLKHTYFKSQMKRKREVITKFNPLTDFQEVVNHTCFRLPLLHKDLDKLIYSFIECPCLLK